jgi:hypothetical protein
MAANVLALFKPVRSEARTALAESIAEGATAEAALTAAQSALVRGRDMVAQARVRHDAAIAGLSDAKATLAGLLAGAAASSGALRVRDTTVRQVRADEDEAADQCNAAAAALVELEDAATAAQLRVAERRAAVENAANAVIADEALTPTIERCRALRAEFDAQTLKLIAAINRELASLKFLSDNREKVTTLQTIESVGHPSFQITGVEWPRAEEFREASRIIDSERKVVDMSVQRPVREAWAKARADLHSDPDATLPVS